MIICDLCKRKVKKERIYAFYPEDSTYICKDCFDKNVEKENLIKTKCAEFSVSKEKEK